MPVSQTLFFLIAQYVGTVAFAASGAMLAIDRGLDLLGVIVLGVTTALGGTPVFLPGESQGRGSLVGCRLWGRTESDTTEVT